MIARARAVAHGSAYTTYATLKRDAEFVCCENIAGDMSVTVTDDDLDNIWLQFKYAGENYIAKGKAVSRNLIAMEGNNANIVTSLESVRDAYLLIEKIKSH